MWRRRSTKGGARVAAGRGARRALARKDAWFPVWRDTCSFTATNPVKLRNRSLCSTRKPGRGAALVQYVVLVGAGILFAIATLRFADKLGYTARFFGGCVETLDKSCGRGRGALPSGAFTRQGGGGASAVSTTTLSMAIVDTTAAERMPTDAEARALRGAPEASVATTRGHDGSVVDADGQGRVLQVATPDGQATRVEYDDKGDAAVLAMRGSLEDAERVWARLGPTAKNGMATFTSPSGDTFRGSVQVLVENDVNDAVRVRGTVIISDASGRVTGGTPDGSTFVEDRGSVRRVTSPTGAVRIETKEPGSPPHWVPYATKDANAVVALDRLVSTTHAADGARVVIETRITPWGALLPNAPKVVTLHPDSDPQDKLVDEARADFAKRGLVPAETTLGQFRELYAVGAHARIAYLAAQIDQRLDALALLREKMKLDGTAIDAARDVLSEQQRALDAMRRAMGKSWSATSPPDPAAIDYVQFARAGATFFDPLHPERDAFQKPDSILGAHARELPGWDERGIAALEGAARTLGGMVTSALEHPVQTASIVVLTMIEPEIMVPALAIYGAAHGTASVLAGIDELRRAERSNNAAAYLRGWERIGAGATEVGVSAGGYFGWARARAAGRAAAADAANASTPKLLAPAEGATAETLAAAKPTATLRSAQSLLRGSHGEVHVPRAGQDPVALVTRRLDANGHPLANNTVFRVGRHGEQILRDVMNDHGAALDSLTPGGAGFRKTVVLDNPVPGFHSLSGQRPTLFDIRRVQVTITRGTDGALTLRHFAPEPPRYFPQFMHSQVAQISALQRGGTLARAVEMELSPTGQVTKMRPTSTTAPASPGTAVVRATFARRVDGTLEVTGWDLVVP